MGKIDKEKLLREIHCKGTGNFNGSGCCNGCNNYNDDHNTTGECLNSIIKNFPEDPEIDFDALYKEYLGSVQFGSIPTAWQFRNFLKSKNLTAPNPVEIPVKKTWTLKKEYHEYHLKMCIGTMVDVNVDEEPQYPEYYDQHEEPDYSKIPKGSIVVVCSKDNKIKSAEIVDFFDNSHIYCNGGISYELKYVKIRIVELAKENV